LTNHITVKNALASGDVTMSFLSVLELIIISFAFIAYLIVLFAVVSDLFRDHRTSGWVKAVWVIFLIILPLLTSVVYLIVRGGGMAERSAAAARAAKESQDAYIREAAGTSPAVQIADAKKLLDGGVITEAEYRTLKAKALS
jgi:Phospholipase_D-nuclease N-terminal